MDRPLTRTLAVIVAAQLLFAGAVAAALTVRGHGSRAAVEATELGPFAHHLRPWYRDSWDPMLTAYNAKAERPERGLYDVFFEDRVKFQYPPTSLLFFDLFPREWTRSAPAQMNEPFWKFLKRLSLAVLLAAVILSALVLERSAGPFYLPRFILAVAAGLLFYPIVYPHEIGQAQIFINAAVPAAVLCYATGRRAQAGAWIGLCCLIKPQMAVVLLWAALRKERRFAAGFAAVLAAGLALSLARYGWADHLSYLQVLKAISSGGESFWLNQSVNGLANRWFSNGSPFAPDGPTDFAPYHPAVHALTLASSALILITALWRKKGGGTVDFCVILAASVMASPVAWNHHYGAFLPLFALAVPLLLRDRPLGQATAVLTAVSYILMAVVVVKPEFFFQDRWLGLVGSHVFFGALLFYILLLKLRRVEGRQA